MYLLCLFNLGSLKGRVQILVLSQNELLELSVGLVQIVIDNDLVMGAGFRILELSRGSSDSLCDGVLSLGTSTHQSLPQRLDRRRTQEQEAGVNATLLDRLDTLHVNVQETDLVLLGNIINGLDGGTVVVARELGPLDEFLLVDQLLEVIDGGEVVVYTVLFTGSWLSGGVGDGKTKLVWVFSKQFFQKSGLAGAGRAGDNNWSRHICGRRSSGLGQFFKTDVRDASHNMWLQREHGSVHENGLLRDLIRE